MGNYRFHFIGIGGISMSALALYLAKKGYYVQGSDSQQSKTIKNLKKAGIKVFLGHRKENVLEANVVVYNYAIKDDNEELKFARKNGLKIVPRGELLGEIAKKYKCVVAIAGSHGKTSTTLMMYNCLRAFSKNPTLHIGGILSNADFGLILGESEYFVTEACEYHDSFLHLTPKVGIVLNLEPEHLDYFKSFSCEKKSYQKFVNNSNIAIVNKQCKLSGNNICRFGIKNGDIVAKNIKQSGGKYSYDCYYKNKFLLHIDLGAYGEHNVINSLAVVLACLKLDVSLTAIKIGLNRELNILRRFEKIQQTPNLIVHDYAHHPSEIQKTIKTFSQCAKRPILIVFQPHTYSRTKSFFADFVHCFANQNKVFFVKTYSAREKYDKTASAFALYKKVRIKNKNCKYFASLKQVKKEILKKENQNFDILILGAGDIDTLCNSLKKTD